MKSIINGDQIINLSQNKIKNTILKAMNNHNEEIALRLTREVLRKIKKGITKRQLSELIHKVLIENGFERAAKLSIAYKTRRLKAKKITKSLGIKDELKLNHNAIRILGERYLKKNETPRQLFRRVAHNVALAEKKYGNDNKSIEEQFFNMMINLEFLPNSPTLMNAGTELGQLSACFVLPINDSLESIFNTLKNTALIHHSGGGVGFNFSNIRPSGDTVKSTNGVASGPISFIKVYDLSTSVIKQGGRRRGANMAILNHNHPDIIKFIKAKQGNDFTNFNFSVSVNDSFMRKVISNEDYWLINPRNNKKLKKINAREVFNQLIYNAWNNGEPGIIFVDEINRKHPLKERITATNPCAEQPLLDYESCTLGSINLSKMIVNEEINWVKLERITRLAVRFLDDVIDVTHFPIPEIKKVTLSNRKIGLGVMGFADLLIKLGIPYDSEKALRIADKLMKFINEKARDESRILGLQKGSFPNFKKSKLRGKAMRNATVTTIAPTGTISLIAGCSSGIEPLYSLVFYHNILEGEKLLEINEQFERELILNDLNKDEIIKELLSNNLKNINLPLKIKKVFRTALEIKPEWHVKMQSMFQKHVDNAVSKTVNLPENATIEDVKKIFLMAYKFKCKGITVYRNNSRKEQVLCFECGDN